MGVDTIIFDHNALTLKKMDITLSLIPSHSPPASKQPSRNRCQPSTQLSIGVPHSLLQALIIGKLLELENHIIAVDKMGIVTMCLHMSVSEAEGFRCFVPLIPRIVLLWQLEQENLKAQRDKVMW